MPLGTVMGRMWMLLIMLPWKGEGDGRGCCAEMPKGGGRFWDGVVTGGFRPQPKGAGLMTVCCAVIQSRDLFCKLGERPFGVLCLLFGSLDGSADNGSDDGCGEGAVHVPSHLCLGILLPLGCSASAA